jgi:hypothetical protein
MFHGRMFVRFHFFVLSLDSTIETIPADEAQRETLAYRYERIRAKAEPGREVEDFERFLLDTSLDG